MIIEKTCKRDAQGRVVSVTEHHHQTLGEFVESCHAEFVERSRRPEIRGAGARELIYTVDLRTDDYWLEPPKLLRALADRLAGDADLWRATGWTRVYVTINRAGQCVATGNVERTPARLPIYST